MNLSIIERQVRESDVSIDALRYLLSCNCECAWLDHKELLALDNEKQLCDFAKDILALKNVGGGYIIVGVQDRTWKPVGITSELPYDSKLLRDKVRRATNLELDVTIVHHRLDITGSTGLFALIYVRASRKRSRRRVPSVVGKDFCSGKPYGLRRGEIYLRRGDSTVKIQSDTELINLLDELEDLADRDSITSSGFPSPFAVEDGTYRLLEKGFETFVGRSSLRSEVISAVTRDPRIWIINVHGAGGVGKSALVNWAVYELYRTHAFESIIQLTAKETILTPTGISHFSRSLYSLENLLDHLLETFQENLPASLDEKKATAIQILSAWSTLLVLDNMESVQDGRILDFVQKLPNGTKAKVLMTSRMKSGAWEMPIPVNELNLSETIDFMRTKATELAIDCPCDDANAKKVWRVTGGLPLAIQWVLGRYKIDRNLDKAISQVMEKDSPVLEFTFRNIWSILSPDARSILGAMTIFDDPPTLQNLAITTEFRLESIEKALSELSDVTLVYKQTQVSDGRIRYVALPITLSFARHQLESMGDFELECRQRHQRYVEQMRLQDSELFRFRSSFDRFGIETDNEKKAAILCQRGNSEVSMGHVSNADLLFKQARDIAPNSAYVYALSASYEISRNRIGLALERIEEACRRATGKTGSLCYAIKARVLDAQRDRYGRVTALEKALEYDADDLITRHQYGVALSRIGNPERAIEQFDLIIDKEVRKAPPSHLLFVALKTRLINLQRLEKFGEVKKGLELLDDLLTKYPHLKGSEAEEFEEFRAH